MALFRRTTEGLFPGYPRTRVHKDRKGRIRYIVDIRYVSPLAARVGDGLGTLFAVGVFIKAIFVLGNGNVTQWWVWAAALILPFALIDLWRQLFRKLLRSHKRVTLSQDVIRIGHKSYDRHQVRGFITRQHPRRFTEHRIASHRERMNAKNKAAPPPRYYGDETSIITCVLTGTALNICTVFGQREIGDIVVRLNGINDALNGELGAGMGMPISVTADSPPGRNGIPS